uniref:Uncharacterized protein n=1 Tax=Fagus sylvatica TaxID=28930 RepID=A0A2N9F4H5_FAGSY
MMVIALLNEMAFKNSVDLGAGLGGFSFFEVDLAEIAGLAWVPIGGGDDVLSGGGGNVTANLWIFPTHTGLSLSKWVSKVVWVGEEGDAE